MSGFCECKEANIKSSKKVKGIHTFTDLESFHAFELYGP